jgi:hypothetical protein
MKLGVLGFAQQAVVGSLVLVLLGSSAAALAKPRLATGDDAEVTYDGLQRVDKSVMSMAWVKPDINLEPYTKLMVVGAGISYAPVDDEGKRWWPGRSDITQFPISEEGKQRFRKEVSEAFSKELGKLERYEIVTEPGQGVLALVGGLIDVVSRVPPVDDCVGRCDIYLDEVGQATLVVELRDSITNEVLARAADRRAAESAGWGLEANTVTVWSEVRRLANTWARIIRKRLEELNTVDDLGR